MLRWLFGDSPAAELLETQVSQLRALTKAKRLMPKDPLIAREYELMEQRVRESMAKIEAEKSR
jgi:hypothetical protein